MWQTKFGRCIYTSVSGYKVYQNSFYRWLTLGSDALQTVVNRHNPRKPVLYYLPALTLMARITPGSSCLLGLGGAGLAHLLATDNGLITAVDCSAEVIDIAKHYFYTDTLPTLTVVHQKAEDFLQQSKNQFIHLIVDLYNAHHFPIHCANERFFINCKKNLDDNGYLAVNLANIKEQWTIFQLVKKHFKNTLVIPIRKSANMVIIAAKNDDKELFMNKLQSTKELKKIFLVSSWGNVGEYKSPY